MKSPAFSWTALLLFSLAALALWLGYSRFPKPPLRIGINNWPGYEFLYLAQEKGFYHEEGVDVQIVEFNSLSECRRAYERNQIDAMGCTVIEVLQVRDQTPRSPQIVRVVDYSNGADVILARDGITTCAGLKGKRIGLELASLGVYILERGLNKGGLSLKDVDVVSINQSSMEQAMRNGDLSAVVTYPPTSVRLLRDAGATTIFSTAEIPAEVVDVIAVESNINKTRSADIAKVLRAFDRAVAFTKEQPAEAHAIMAEREGITAEEFASALVEGVKLVSAADQEAYLKTDGKLTGVINDSDRILRATEQIKGPDRRQNAVHHLPDAP